YPHLFRPAVLSALTEREGFRLVERIVFCLSQERCMYYHAVVVCFVGQMFCGRHTPSTYLLRSTQLFWQRLRQVTDVACAHCCMGALADEKNASMAWMRAQGLDGQIKAM